MSAPTTRDARLMVRLELALHRADCGWSDHYQRGHGTKYLRLAEVAYDVLTSDEPGPSS